jgi:hypothetical protein
VFWNTENVEANAEELPQSKSSELITLVTVVLALQILAGLKILMSTDCRAIFYAQATSFV